MKNGKHPEAKSGDLKRAEHAFTRYYCDIDEHIRLTGEPCEFEDLLKPTFWSRNVDRLKRGDVLRVVKEGEFDCELFVAWVGPGGCGVKISGAVVGTRLHARLVAAEAAAKGEAQEALANSIAGSAP